MDNKALEQLKIIGSWVALETQKRKYKEKELKELSEALQFLKKYLSDE